MRPLPMAERFRAVRSRTYSVKFTALVLGIDPVDFRKWRMRGAWPLPCDRSPRKQFTFDEVVVLHVMVDIHRKLGVPLAVASEIAARQVPDNKGFVLGDQITAVAVTIAGHRIAVESKIEKAWLEVQRRAEAERQLRGA